MSAYSSWMDIQMAAIFGNAEALAAIDKVTAELGPNATDAEREVVWQRVLKENAEEAEKAKKPDESEEPDARRPRLNTEDLEEVHHDDQGSPQMRMVNDEPPSGRLEGDVLVYDPRGVEEPAELPAEVPAEVPTEEPKAEAPLGVLGDLSPAERAIADPDVAAILDDPEVLEIFTLMRQEAPESDIAAVTVLMPYMSKPSEVLYTFGDIGTQNAIKADHHLQGGRLPASKST